MTEGLQSKEGARELFKKRLSLILDRKITVETIDSYMDRSIDELVLLTDEVVKDYRAKHPDVTSTGKELEDAAFADNGLGDIGEFLDVAQQKVSQLNHIDEYIATRIATKSEVITLPDAWEGFQGTRGGYEKPDVKHRLKSLLYVLENRNIDLEALIVKDGVLRENMVRETSYVSVVIPELDRLALVCDEEGNASYVFDLAQMKDVGVSIDAVEQMSKDERRAFIEHHPGIGVRFNYSVDWIDRAEGFLFDQLPEAQQKGAYNIDRDRTSENIEGLPKVSRRELDPWKGFLTDGESGKHWGNIESLAAQTGINRIVLTRICQQREFTTMDLVGISNRRIIAFCYEDLIADSEVQEYMYAFTMEAEGEWKGFHIDEQGNHWGNQDQLADKIGLARNVVKRIAEKNALVKRSARSDTKRLVDVYCYEELLVDNEIKDLMTAHRAEKEGEWKGFYTDEHGKHWGGLSNLKDKIDIGRDFIEHLVSAEGSSLRSIKMKPVSGPVTDGYCYEEVMEASEIKEYFSAPGVDRVGEWKGFHTDSEGNHWGIPSTLALKLGFALSVIHRFIDEGKFATKKVRDLVGGVKQAICYEAFMEDPNFKRFSNAPIAEKEGEWEGFYVDPEGNHWGPVNALSRKIGIIRDTLLRVIDRNKALQPILMRDITGRDNESSYCYEVLMGEQHVQDILAAPRVVLEGEWKGFYEDKDGKHWANISSLVDKLGISYAVIERSIGHDGKAIHLRGVSGKYGESGYCYEDIIAKDEIREMLDAPQTEHEGEWKGFYVDPEGNHWGPIRWLARRNKMNTRTIQALIRKNGLAMKRVRGANGVLNGYKYEDIVR